MSVGVMAFLMATISFLMAGIFWRISNLYGENHIALWRKLFWYGKNYLGSITYGGNYLQRETLGGLEHYGDGCFFAKAFASLCLISRATRWRSSSAKRANREAESGRRCSSVVKYWFNGAITALMNSNNWPASFCLSLP